jgi:pilus assembly protein CpaC
VNFPGGILTDSGGGVSLFGGGQVGQTAFRLFIQALRQNNLLRILAEPNLVAISGQEASFLAGGEFPIPVPQTGTGGGSTITIEYKEFGVRLNMTPVVLGDGRIRLKLTPEVSDLDFSSPLVIQGSRIPIVNKRIVTTVVELADGQSFAIAGLLNNQVNAAKDVTPLLGDIPILGALFRSVRYERRETELVVLVTPKLVEPMNPSQVPPLPGESWRHPNEAEIYLNQDLGGEEPEMIPGEPIPATTPATTGRTARASDVQSSGPAAPRYRGSYGFTPPQRAISTASNE